MIWENSVRRVFVCCAMNYYIYEFYDGTINTCNAVMNVCKNQQETRVASGEHPIFCNECGG